MSGEAVQPGASPRSAGGRSPWRLAGSVIVLVLAGILGIFHETAASIHSVWASSETFSHGYVIVPIVLFLVWQRRQRLAAVEPRPWPWALGGLVVAGLAWLVAAAGDVTGIQHFALAAMIPFTVWAVLGHTATRVLVFPLAYLFFAVPFGAFLIQPMMILTADMTVGLVRASGVPVYREALEFSLPSGNWSVIEACSGLRYLIASIALGVLYAHLMYRAFWRQAVFVLAAIVVPIIANGLRAYMIVMIGHLSGMEYAVGVDHLLYGWVFFGIVIFLLFWIGTLWSDGGPRLGAAGGDSGHASRALSSAGVRGIALTGIAAVLIAAIWPTYSVQVVRGGDGAVPELAQPAPGGAWQPAPTPIAEWRPNYRSPRAALEQHYTRDGEAVGLYVGYYRDQLEYTEMLAWGHALAPSSGPDWRQLGMRAEAARGLDGVRPAEAVLGRDRERLLAWRWYWVDGVWTASRVEVKARITLARLLNRGDDSAVVVVYAPFDHSPDEVRDRLRDFSRRALPELRAILGDAAS